MSRSRPFDLVMLLKSMWNDHPKNAGRKYGGESRDLHEAKLWLEIHPEFDFVDITDLSDRFGRFMLDTFDGWAERDWPVWGFLKHYNRYAAPRERPKAKKVEYCPVCDAAHEIGKCPKKQLRAI